MKGLLKMDPKDRMSSNDAINHPYFEGLKEEEEGV